jgi:hypothetical protein
MAALVQSVTNLEEVLWKETKLNQKVPLKIKNWTSGVMMAHDLWPELQPPEL